MRIIGLLRVRNVDNYISITLGHMASFCDGVYVYNDCSQDSTEYELKNNSLVLGYITNLHYDSNRGRAEYVSRERLLRFAKRNEPSCDWFVYLDADEYPEYDFGRLREFSPEITGVRMRLFDFYITDHDKYQHYLFREYMGPEYREILIAFRNVPGLNYSSFDQREVHLPPGSKIVKEGYVRHYGKAISVEQWEAKCDYYMTFPKYAKKWSRRKGKAVHTVSSFNQPLITWDQRDTAGMLMTKDMQKQDCY